MSAHFKTLDEWLRWQETLHPRAIVMGLERVESVYRALGSPRPARHVVTIAGTNGKGTCVALLDSLYRGAGYRVGTYTSPHLLRYNERVTIGGEAVTDDALIRAFERVEAARGERTLTYFEFGTLAALVVLAGADLDLALLEVGMGGRLDATNIIDPDIAVITSVGLDHQEWLGETREAIAHEKAGIARPGRPLVCGDRSLADVLADAAPAAMLSMLGREFDYQRSSTPGEPWRWWSASGPVYNDLPATGAQPDNAAAVIQVAELLSGALPWEPPELAAALRDFALPGRRQKIGTAPEVWLDVAHNREAIDALIAVLEADSRPVHLVFGILEGKPVRRIATALAPLAAHWHIAAPDCPRALPVADLETALDELGQPFTRYANINEAFLAARGAAGRDGRVVVTGSFYTVAEVMPVVEQYLDPPVSRE